MNPIENENYEDSDGDIELKNNNVPSTEKAPKPRKPYTRKGDHVMTEPRKASFEKARAAREANIAQRKAEKEQQELLEKEAKQKKLLEAAEKIKKTKQKAEKLIDKVAEPVKRKHKRVVLVSDSSDDDIEIVKKKKPKEELKPEISAPVAPPVLPPKKRPINFV